ncbi:hypothetical protein [Fimbriiglobus ruber]|uniref:Response regulatory domain-containing protein n=1 Tax=Fimbriiglobus ruber TaxID=1908690 RepID=A0A225DC45_9BACT|nr:hypothetical protein [Fimbriiglobus ruber]OWK39160.1 hypothetical protein FRUB_06242 [Fimbriiglobus ruber]
MTTAPLHVLLVTSPDASADALRDALLATGCTVADLPPGTPPDAAAAHAVVVSVGAGAVPAAAARTRTVRAALGEHLVPILWVVPAGDAAAEAGTAGMDAGADACLTWPVAPALLAAQLRAAARVRTRVGQLATRATAARGINEQLQKAFRQAEADAKLVKQVQQLALPKRLPAVGAARFGVSHHARAGAGGALYDVTRLDPDHVAFWLADAGGAGTAGNGLVGLCARLAIEGRDVDDAGARVVPPPKCWAG